MSLALKALVAEMEAREAEHARKISDAQKLVEEIRKAKKALEDTLARVNSDLSKAEVKLAELQPAPTPVPPPTNGNTPAVVTTQPQQSRWARFVEGFNS